jgi:hypothetical protein
VSIVCFCDVRRTEDLERRALRGGHQLLEIVDRELIEIDEDLIDENEPWGDCVQRTDENEIWGDWL